MAAKIPQAQILESDHLLIHRDGVDYKTPFTTLLSSIPEVDFSIPGVLTYQGIVESNAVEPDQNQGELWLLKTVEATADWVPDGAETGDYLTWAEDSEGAKSWHIIGNCGVDFGEFATKEEVAAALTEVNNRLEEKASASDLQDLSDKHDALAFDVEVSKTLIQQNGKKLGEVETQVENLEEQVKQNTDDIASGKEAIANNTSSLAGLDSSLDYVRGKVDTIDGDLKGVRATVTGQGVKLKAIENAVEGNYTSITKNKEAIDELKATPTFNVGKLELLPSS